MHPLRHVQESCFAQTQHGVIAARVFRETATSHQHGTPSTFESILCSTCESAININNVYQPRQSVISHRAFNGSDGGVRLLIWWWCHVINCSAGGVRLLICWRCHAINCSDGGVRLLICWRCHAINCSDGGVRLLIWWWCPQKASTYALYAIRRQCSR